MSRRRAAARHYAVSDSVAVKWLERVERDGRENLSDMAAIGPPSWRCAVIFWKQLG
jgi:transposase